MRTVREYLSELKNIGFSDDDGDWKFEFGFTAKSVAEAKAGLSRILSMEKQLNHLKKRIDEDIRTLRSEKSTRKTKLRDARRSPSKEAFITRMEESIYGLHSRANEAADDKILGYLKLKNVLDDTLVQMDSAKRQIRAYIARNQVKTSRDTGGTRPCSFCGGGVASGTGYCPYCGRST